MKTRGLFSRFIPTAAIILILLALLSGCAKKEEKKREGKIEKPESQLSWPTCYHDPQRTGRGVSSGPQSPQVLWIQELGVQSKAFAVLDKNENIIAPAQGKISCLDKTSGKPIWEFPTQGASATIACISNDGTIYASAGNIVYSISPEGSAKWSFDMGSLADQPSVSEDGFIYVGSTGGRLVALNKEGKIKWEQKVPGNIRSPSFSRDGDLLCSASPLVLYCFDENGKKKWEFKPEGELPLYDGMFDWANTLEAPSVGDDGTIYAGSFVSPGVTKTGQQIPGYSFPSKAKVYAITPRGEKKWEYQTQEQTGSTILTPSIGRDGTLYSGTSFMKVLAFTPEGTLTWEFNTAEPPNVCPFVYSPSIGKDGLLYAATSSSRIFCITPQGIEKWRYGGENPWLPDMTGSNNFTPSPIAKDGKIYSILFQGKVYAFSP